MQAVNWLALLATATVHQAGAFCHGHRPVISSTVLQLRVVRMAIMRASRPRALGVISTVIVLMMAAATRTSRPINSPRAIAGGSMGFLLGASADLAFDDPRLDVFAEAMVNDTSSLILVGDVATLDDFVSAVGPFGGKIIQTDLNEDDIKALRKGLKMEG